MIFQLEIKTFARRPMPVPLVEDCPDVAGKRYEMFEMLAQQPLAVGRTSLRMGAC